jgi:hypothetical protein
MKPFHLDFARMEMPFHLDFARMEIPKLWIFIPSSGPMCSKEFREAGKNGTGWETEKYVIRKRVCLEALYSFCVISRPFPFIPIHYRFSPYFNQF